VAELAGAGAERVVGELEAALAGFEATDMRLYAAVTRRRIGVLRGGAAEVAAADAFMRGEAIVAPAKMTRMLAPGAG
jgi:hypothetical protein